jgi:hypothetical protein
LASLPPSQTQPEYIEELLEDLCVFANDDGMPPVAQAALAHAQFETIHPFTDGNGRTGRARPCGRSRRASPFRGDRPMQSTVEFFDFGVPVDLKVPAPSETTDITTRWVELMTTHSSETTESSSVRSWATVTAGKVGSTRWTFQQGKAANGSVCTPGLDKVDSSTVPGTGVGCGDFLTSAHGQTTDAGGLGWIFGVVPPGAEQATVRFGGGAETPVAFHDGLFVIVHPASQRLEQLVFTRHGQDLHVCKPRSDQAGIPTLPLC